MPEPVDVDVLQIIDGTISDCLATKIPALPSVIAETVAGILCQRGTATERARMFAELLVLTRERLELLTASNQVVH